MFLLIKKLKYSDAVFCFLLFSTIYILIYNIFYYSPSLGYDANAHFLYVDHLARGLSLVCNILDPDIIVLGGGMSNISYIYDHINTSLKKYIFSDTFNTKVVKNKHGDSGGVRGAAWLS